MIGNFFRVLLVLWSGSLWSLALWVAPTLFYAQPDRHLAGLLAARLFSIETYLGLGVAALAMAQPKRLRFVAVYLVVALLSVNEWALQRVMASAHAHGSAAGLSFAAWHGVSALLYVLACLSILVLVWKQPLGGR